MTEPDGSETIPMVKDGQTRRGALGSLVGVVAAPHVAAAQMARDQVADLVLPQNIFVDVSQATAEAALEPGTNYKLVDSSTGLATVLRRDAGGSTPLYKEATATALGANVEGLGPFLIGSARRTPGAPRPNIDERAVADDLRDIAYNVRSAGVRGDGSAQGDELRAIFAGEQHVHFPYGDYPYAGDPIQLRPGQTVTGQGAGLPFDTAFNTRLRHTEPGGACLVFTQSDVIDTRGPHIRGLELTADFPIVLNDPEKTIIGDGGAVSNAPPICHWLVRECSLLARVPGIGHGFSGSKLFDGEFSLNRVEGFDVGILLWGCDLNSFTNNRVVVCKSVAILEAGSISFTSQNEIAHNDLLYMTGSDAVFIRSSARHSWYYNNYLEQAGSTIAGFFDFSGIDQPLFSGQGPGDPFTIVARDNRIDGMHFAQNYIYRLERARRYYVDITDLGTSGVPRTAPALLLVDSKGAEVGDFPVRHNEFNGTSISIKGTIFGEWDAFQTSIANSKEVDGTNLGMLGGTLNINDVRNFLGLRPDGFTFKKGFTQTFEIIDLPFFEAETEYTLEIDASTIAGEDTLRIGSIRNGVSSSATDYLLNTEEKPIIYTFVPGNGPGSNGIYFIRTNTSAEQSDFVCKMKFKKRADISTPFIVTDSYQYTPENYTGEIMAEASEVSAAGFVRKIYRFLNGRAVLVGEDNTFGNPTVLDITATQAGGVITFALSGSAGGKKINLRHNYRAAIIP